MLVCLFFFWKRLAWALCLLSSMLQGHVASIDYIPFFAIRFPIQKTKRFVPIFSNHICKRKQLKIVTKQKPEARLFPQHSTPSCCETLSSRPLVLRLQSVQFRRSPAKLHAMEDPPLYSDSFTRTMPFRLSLPLGCRTS